MFGENNSQLIAAIEHLTKRIEYLENSLKNDKTSKNIEVFAQIIFNDVFEEVSVGEWDYNERPFDNVRAIFNPETGNLIYIGLIDDLPF